MFNSWRDRAVSRFVFQPQSPYRDYKRLEPAWIVGSQTQPMLLMKNNNQAHHPPRLLLFYLHGNADNIGGGPRHLWEEIQKESKLNQVDLVFAAPEYPGYCPRTFGQVAPTVEETKASVWKAYQWVRRTYPHHKPVVMGRSLGTGFATWVAAQDKRIENLVLVSPFSSMNEVASEQVTCGVSSLVPQDYLDNAAELSRAIEERSLGSSGSRSNYALRVLLFHGARDTLIDPQHSRILCRLFNQAKTHREQKIRLIIEPEQTHNSIPDLSPPLVSFLLS